MAILVPKRLIPRSKAPTGSPHVGKFFKFSEVAGQKVEVADLIGHLVTLRRSDAVRTLVWLLAHIRSVEGIRAEVQMALAERFFDADLLNSLRDLATRDADEAWVIFHCQQILFLYQMVVLCCREETAQCSEEHLRKTLGRCCLLASDVVGQGADPRLPDDAPPDKVEEWLATVLLPRKEFSSDIERPEILVRAKRLWLELPATGEIQREVKRAGFSDDLGAIFHAKFGISLSDFIQVGITAYGFFLQQQKASPQLLRPEQLFGPVNATESACRALAIMSRTPGDLAAMLLDRPRQSWFLDFTVMRRYPILEVLPDQYACLDVSLLYRFLWEGVYWLFVEGLGPQADDFKALFGHVFEAYAKTAIDEFAYSGSQLAKTFFPHPKFDGTNDEVCDGLLYWPKTAVLMEYKSGILTTRQKYAGNTKDLFEGIDNLLIRDDSGRPGKCAATRKGVGQLAESIARILRGESVTSGGSGIDLQGCRLLPVLIAYDEVLGIHAVQHRANRRMTQFLEKRKVSRERVRPVLVLTLEDLEAIEDLQAEASVESLLLDYSEYLLNNPTDNIGSFQAYIYGRFPSIERTAAKKRAARVVDEVVQDLGKRLDSVAPRTPQ